jgi:hypothetical protein
MAYGTGADQLDKNAKGKPILKSRNEKNLRDRYAQWLERTGVKAFGQVIDHEAYLEPEAQGDPDVDVSSEGPDGPAEGQEPAFMPPAIAAAVQDVREAWANAAARSTRGPGNFSVPPAEFDRLLRDAVVACTEDDIGPLVELTARLEKLG